MKKWFFLFLMLLLPGRVFANIQAKTVEYKHGDTVLEGYVSFDDSIGGKRPGILLVHEWKGLGDQVKKRADMLAALGYTAFAVDMYGKGIRPQTNEEAAKQAGIYKNDRKLMRERVKAGLEILKQQPTVDTTKLAAIGYCFGGTTILELARSGEDMKGFVSFHGALNTPTPEDAKNIKGKVLALHGADDPNVPEAEVKAFEEEMRSAKADWQLIAYGGAVHSFTNPEAGNDNSRGAAYNEKADKRSWETMKVFFREIFA